MKYLLVVLLTCAYGIANAQIDIPYPQPLADTTAITFLPGIVSKDSIDFGSAFSPDGKSFYFARTANKRSQIYVTHHNGKEWETPTAVAFTASNYSEADPAFAPDGKLYFISNRPTSPTDSALDYDIWFVTPLANGSWSAPENVKSINSDSSEFYISFSKNGNLYFSSSRKGGFGEEDIYVSRLINGQYIKPENLGVAINSSKSEYDPCISPDEDLIVFASSNRQDGFGKADLYYSKKGSDSAWHIAANLGQSFNTKTREYCSYITPDQNYFFFSSEGDIKWINYKTLLKQADAQKLQRPSERYIDAYKKYVNATCPIPKDSIQHFVYFARDRELIKGHTLLTHPMFKGAQIMYSWRELEPQKGQYDFSIVKEDIEYLKKFGKKLFIQLQDATFNPKYKAIPEYVYTNEYDSGATLQYNDEGKPEGWVAKRWNAKVRERFALLLQVLGNAFDGKIEGINLQETAIGVRQKTDPSFTKEGYVNGLKANMLALKKAFSSSTTMIYANFMPGEWLPDNDKGYLRSIYQYGEEIGVGLGGPDLMVTRKGQLNHTLALMHEGQYTVPIGIAVQDGNYTGTTGGGQNNKEG